MTSDKLTHYTDKLDQVFYQMMRRIHNELGAVMDKGVTGSQFVVMKRISGRGRMTVSAVAEDLNVSLSAITALVDRLCRNGMVKRLRDDNDRRLVWLELTDEGREMLNSCVEARKRVMEKYLGQLPEEDLVTLIRIYENLLEIFKKDAPDRA